MKPTRSSIHSNNSNLACLFAEAWTIVLRLLLYLYVLITFNLIDRFEMIKICRIIKLFNLINNKMTRTSYGIKRTNMIMMIKIIKINKMIKCATLWCVTKDVILHKINIEREKIWQNMIYKRELFEKINLGQNMIWDKRLYFITYWYYKKTLNTTKY